MASEKTAALTQPRNSHEKRMCSKARRACDFGAEPTHDIVHDQTQQSFQIDITTGSVHQTQIESPAAPVVAISPDQDDTISHGSSSGSTRGFASKVDRASMRWLDMLGQEFDVGDSDLLLSPVTLRPSLEILRSRPAYVVGDLVVFDHSSPAFLRANLGFPVRGSGHRTAGPEPWHTEKPIQLTKEETLIFTRYVDTLSHWIDLFDPLQHFSSLVPRLALFNEGMMKAILALAARHMALKPSTDQENPLDRTVAVHYYHETLRLLQNAMCFETYGHNPELVATALIVAMYEMMDEAGKSWQRHLEGIFWIQRSLDNSGESGGLRQAVWWAWLRQDAWSAFCEGRKCYSFFTPTRPFESLTPHDMSNRSVFILSKVVNYCSKEACAQSRYDLQKRASDAKAIRALLDEWYENTTIHFHPLPLFSLEAQFCEPIYIRPTAFAAAFQLHCFAKILLLAHSPTGSVLENRAREKEISQLSDTICGIAVTYADNDPSLIVSTQSVYVAGLFCRDEWKRDRICDLIHAHQSATGWPVQDLREKLRKQWTYVEDGI